MNSSWALHNLSLLGDRFSVRQFGPRTLAPAVNRAGLVYGPARDDPHWYFLGPILTFLCYFSRSPVDSTGISACTELARVIFTARCRYFTGQVRTPEPLIAHEQTRFAVTLPTGPEWHTIPYT